MDDEGTTSTWLRTRDGRQLHVERAGTGAPTVVLEAGMGMARTAWGSVAPRIAARTSVVAYDRSGLGRSPATTTARDLAHLAADQVDVLDQLGPGPFVLVGHSWGGPIVRTAAAERPDLVGGLVLVDPSDEGCSAQLAESTRRQGRIVAAVAPALARAGVFRLTARHLARSVPEPAATAMRAEDGTPAAVRAQLAEATSSIDDLVELRDAPLPTPDVPLTIISGTRTGPLGRARRAALVSAHEARAAASPAGRHVHAERSGHFVLLTEPDLVAAEVLRVVELVGGG